jgi:hypothetical protein
MTRPIAGVAAGFGPLQVSHSDSPGRIVNGPSGDARTKASQTTFANTVDHRIRFAYRAAFVTGTLERVIRHFAPDFPEPSLRQPVVPERVSIV